MIDEDEMAEGEFIELNDDEPADVVDTEDGGAIVKLGEDDGAPGSTEFYANLAEDVPDSTLNPIATGLLDLLAKDAEARKKRDQQQEEGLRRTGLGDDAPGGAQFEGASKVVHPMLTEACVDFSARAIKELFPADGPVKDKIIGDTDEKKVSKAKRKTALMNWQLTEQAKEMRGELEQLLTQLPLGGAQYMKVSWNKKRNRPNFEFIAIDDMLLPYAATNFYTSHRKAHRQFITRAEYRERVKSGMYRDVDLVSPGMEPEQTMSGEANDKIEGREQSAYNEDGLRTVFEVYVTMELDFDDKADGDAPYIITIDKVTNTVLSVYRNWAEEDETDEPLVWIIEWPFIPWRGAYPIGLPHMIGGLAGSATGALRALLDSAHINNTPSMLKLKGGQVGGQSTSVAPGQIAEIEGGLNVDDIRKLAMPMPYNQPSPVLFQLLGFLVEQGKGVVRTALDNIPDQNPNAPVGTTLAHIEQGLVVYSAIHTRLHNAMARLLTVLHRLNGLYLDDERVEREAGEELARRSDFQGPMDVVPVSDPNIFSEAQRFAQVQAVAQRAQLQPMMYNLRKVEQRILETLKIPAADELLNPAAEAVEEHAINENVAASLGRPIVAFPEQDHISHIKAHIMYTLNPLFGLNPMIAPALLPMMLNHLKEHLVLWYAQSATDAAGKLAGVDLNEAIKEHKDKETRQAFDDMLAETAREALEAAADIFAELPQVFAEMQQLAQQFAPPVPPPADPAQVAMAETQRKAAADQAKVQIEDKRMQTSAADAEAKRQADMQKEALRQQSEDQRSMMDNQTKLTINEQDNQTALQIAEAELLSGDNIAIENGGGLNPG